jgi:hypothetical protein
VPPAKQVLLEFLVTNTCFATTSVLVTAAAAAGLPASWHGQQLLAADRCDAGAAGALVPGGLADVVAAELARAGQEHQQQAQPRQCALRAAEMEPAAEGVQAAGAGQGGGGDDGSRGLSTPTAPIMTAVQAPGAPKRAPAARVLMGGFRNAGWPAGGAAPTSDGAFPHGLIGLAASSEGLAAPSVVLLSRTCVPPGFKECAFAFLVKGVSAGQGSDCISTPLPAAASCLPGCRVVRLAALAGSAQQEGGGGGFWGNTGEDAGCAMLRRAASRTPHASAQPFAGAALPGYQEMRCTVLVEREGCGGDGAESWALSW